MVSNLRSHDIVYLLGVIVYILTRFYREHEVELGLVKIRFFAVAVTVRERIFAFRSRLCRREAKEKQGKKIFSKIFENLVGIRPLAAFSIVEG